MINSKVYVIEKLTQAMDALATCPGDIRSRLVIAHQCLKTLSENDFPDQLKKDWTWIYEQLTKFGPMTLADGTHYYGSVEHTMKRIQNRTGVKIAERISKLYWEISANEKYS